MDWDTLDAIMEIDDLAKFLKCGYRRALELCHTKGFPSLRVGRKWKISRDGLKRWLEAQTGGK